MNKIATPQDLQTELRCLLALVEDSNGEKPSREKLAADIRELADRVAGYSVAPKTHEILSKAKEGVLEAAVSLQAEATDNPSVAERYMKAKKHIDQAMRELGVAQQKLRR